MTGSKSNRDIRIPFDSEEALRTGTFTSGSSGSGKTVLNFHFADILMRMPKWTDPQGNVWTDGAIVYVIDPSQAWRKSSVSNLLDIRYPEKGQVRFTFKNGNARQSTVFDVSMLTYKQRIELTEKLCKTLLDHRKRSERRPPTFVVFEEAQLIFYQGSMRSLKRHSNAVELVTNGRNFNIRYGVITQFPSMIDKLLVKMTRQRYFGWTSEPNDIDYIEEIVGKDEAQFLPTLEVGEFMYSYPRRGNEGATKIKVPMFRKRADIKVSA